MNHFTAKTCYRRQFLTNLNLLKDKTKNIVCVLEMNQTTFIIYFIYRSDSVTSPLECSDFHRSWPVSMTRNRRTHGLGYLYEEGGRIGNGFPRPLEQLDMVLWHLGYNSNYVRMTATVLDPHAVVPCLSLSFSTFDC